MITKKKLEKMTLQERQELVQLIAQYWEVIVDCDYETSDVPRYKRKQAEVHNVPRWLIGIVRRAVYEAEQMRTPRFTHEYIAEWIENKYWVQIFW